MGKARRPAPKPSTPSARELPDQLRDAIAQRGVSCYQLGKAAQVDPSQIARFLSGERDITITTAGRLCTALQLRLGEKVGKVGRPASNKTARPLSGPDE